MTKKDMARQIAEAAGLPHNQVTVIVQRVLDAVTDTLLRQGRIELRNFGIFQVRKRKPRQARNPRTGVAVSVPAKTVVTFKSGKELEERVARLKDGGESDRGPS